MFARFSSTWRMAEPRATPISFFVLARAVAHLASISNGEKRRTGARASMDSRTALSEGRCLSRA